LQDEAISAREAAVTLLGRHAASNQALALRLFNTLAKARRVCCWPDADLPCLFGGAEHIVIGKAPHILRSAELVHKRQPPCLPTSRFKAMLVRELKGDPEDTTLRLLYTTPESLATERLRWVTGWGRQRATGRELLY